MAEGLQTSAQDDGLDAATSTVLRAGASGLKKEASQSAKSTIEKATKPFKTNIKSRASQTINRLRDVLGV